jgi:hypothetical protein
MPEPKSQKTTMDRWGKTITYPLHLCRLPFLGNNVIINSMAGTKSTKNAAQVILRRLDGKDCKKNIPME